MNHYRQFSYHIKGLINWLVAEPGLDPETISKNILAFLSAKNTSTAEETELNKLESNLKYDTINISSVSGYGLEELKDFIWGKINIKE